MIGRVLVIDDDPDICALLVAGLTRRGFDVLSRTSATAALELVTRDDVDVVLTDVRMPDMSGLELCERMVDSRPDVPVMILTAAGGVDTAIAAIRVGAYDFALKPPDMNALAIALERAVQHRRLRSRVKQLQQSGTRNPTFGELLGASAPMQHVYEFLERVADSDASVLLTGESGTGKDLVARALHASSRRSTGPYVVVNCASVPEALLESELFGHVRGAFTDARESRTGLFAKAFGGTLFLDEIGELPLALQPKLLRAIQERTVRPVGADTEIPCDVRFITATNRDLEAAVKAGRFREDLYFRIAVIHVAMPPLRARGEDVLLLAQHFLERYAARAGKRIRGLSPAAAERLLGWDWPGNVRELQNCIERSVALARYEEIVVDDLPEKIRGSRRARVLAPEDGPELVALEEVERRHIERVLEAVAGNQRRCAELLGIDRKTLHRKLERYSGPH